MTSLYPLCRLTALPRRGKGLKPLVFRRTALLMLVVGLGCSDPASKDGGAEPRFEPIDTSSAAFWDRQTTQTAELLQTFVDEYNATDTAHLPMRLVSSGNYSDIYRKLTASIRAGQLPSMAVAYESMTTEYIQAEAVAPMERFFDSASGFGAEELDDFFPSVIATNTFEEYGGKLYSFPFTKSVLMLYFNKRVMKEAGLSEPPKTWDEFLSQCRTVKRETGKFALALDIDASTVDGLIFSMGGEVLGGGETLFNSPESIRAFELLETLYREKLAYQIPPRTFDDETDFGQDLIAFSLRSSSGKPHFEMLMEDLDAWGMAAIPQADPAHPHTVLYGANICIFDTTPEQQAAAWGFTKYFTSTETTVRWALGTGYLPVRKSAAEDPAMQAFWAEWPYNRTAFDCLSFAKPEPNVAGWQEVRGLIEKAETAVLTGMMTGRVAAEDLKRRADAALAAR